MRFQRPSTPVTSSSPVKASSPASVLLPSITATSALHQSTRVRSRDEFICQVADDISSNSLQSIDPPIEAIGLLSNGTMSKFDLQTVLSCDTPKVPISGLECVQCVEVFPDTMNHCVPDWDAAGREMDVIWEPTDIFSPSRGKWDSGHTKKTDLGFVPEHDFEELCWEDGQLLVVMQGLSSRGNSKNRSCWQQANVGEMAPLTSGIQTTAIGIAVDTLGTAELMDPSTLNMHSQEDELLSWLQHPPEDPVDKLVVHSDTVSPSIPVVNSEVVLPNDLTHCNVRRNRAVSEDHGSRFVSKKGRNESVSRCQMNTLNRLGQDSCGGNQQIQSNIVAERSSVSTASMTSKEPCKPCSVTARVGMPSTEMLSAAMAGPCGSPMQNSSSGAMNFSNFSRPAVTFKANLHSLGMVNGPSGAERLKQLERASAGAYKLESIDSTTRPLRLIAPRKGGVGLRSSTIPQSTGGSNLHNSGQTLSLNKGSEHDASAVWAGNSCSAHGAQSDGLNSSLISSSTFGLEKRSEVLEVAELSDSSSSGGSGTSDDTEAKKVASVRKRKCIDEDTEIQSKALGNEATGSKKHAMGGGNCLKKSRATENHNQSERRRRDRISEKMKALQALVPNSYKTDKASMLEEAISYIKALKAQIQMMSSRSGMYFSPVLMQQGMQPVQIAPWPHMGMGTGMGVSAGMGIFDISMVMAAAASRQFSPMLPFPSAVVPAVQTGASGPLDSTHLVHGVASQLVAVSAPQMVVPTRPEVPIAGTRDSSLAQNGISSKTFLAPQQQPQPVQGAFPQVRWMGGNSSTLPYPQRCLQPIPFMTGFGSLQQQ